MRLTWLVLGVVVAAAAVAFINTDDAPPALPKAKAEGSQPGLNRSAGANDPKPGFDLSVSEEEVKAREAREGAPPEARRGARGGQQEPPRSRRRSGATCGTPRAPAAMPMSKAAGSSPRPEHPRQERHCQEGPRPASALTCPLPAGDVHVEGCPHDRALQGHRHHPAPQRQVMLYGPGVPGVTAPYTVPAGIVPVQIISRQKLPMGSNAICSGTRAAISTRSACGAIRRFYCPRRSWTLQVHLKWRRLGIFIGDWFVKEWPVGIGAEDSPTPTGVFTILSRQINPAWHPRGGKLVHWGDPRTSSATPGWPSPTRSGPGRRLRHPRHQQARHRGHPLQQGLCAPADPGAVGVARLGAPGLGRRQGHARHHSLDPAAPTRRPAGVDEAHRGPDPREAGERTCPCTGGAHAAHAEPRNMGTCDVGTCDVGTCDVGTCDVGTCDVGTCDVGTCDAVRPAHKTRRAAQPKNASGRSCERPEARRKGPRSSN